MTASWDTSTFYTPTQGGNWGYEKDVPPLVMPNQGGGQTGWGQLGKDIQEGVGGFLGNLALGQIGKATANVPLGYGAGVAQQQINDQIQRIQQLTQELQSRTEYYRQLGQASKEQLGKISGITVPDYRLAAIKQFNEGVAAERATGERYLKGYDPSLLGSAAGGRFRSAISNATEDYRKALGGLSAEGGQRFLTSSTAVPIAAFKSIADDKDYNMLLNPEFMSTATNPMTVNMDLMKYKPYMTYNV